jgi:PAS domain S-box-containing protein
LPDGKLTFVDETYCKYFGKTPAELMGHSFMPLIPEEHHPKIEERFAPIGPENSVTTHEHPVIAPKSPSLRQKCGLLR